MTMVGKHLLVDGRCRRPHTLNDAACGSRLLETIVHDIDMTMILPPLTVKFPHSVSEMTRTVESLVKEGLADSKTCQEMIRHLQNRRLQTYGYSTLVMIAESHLSLHTFPEEDFFTFDCYSCKDFDHDKVLQLIAQEFPGLNMNVSTVNRVVPPQFPDQM